MKLTNLSWALLDEFHFYNHLRPVNNLGLNLYCQLMNSEKNKKIIGGNHVGLLKKLLGL